MGASELADHDSQEMRRLSLGLNGYLGQSKQSLKQNLKDLRIDDPVALVQHGIRCGWVHPAAGKRFNWAVD